jgi:hypothetical protein
MAGNELWWVALVAAGITGPLSGLIAHYFTTRRLLRENALMEKRLMQENALTKSRQEHEVVFQGVYTRQADTISELYSLIVDLADAFNLWLLHDDMVEAVEHQLSSSDPEIREDLEQRKQEYDVNARGVCE